MNLAVQKTITKDLYRQEWRNFPRCALEVQGLHKLYQADFFVTMIPHAKQNKGYKYLITVINTFSWYAYAIPFKTETGVDGERTLGTLVNRDKVKYLQTDNSKEY